MGDWSRLADSVNWQEKQKTLQKDPLDISRRKRKHDEEKERKKREKEEKEKMKKMRFPYVTALDLLPPDMREEVLNMKI